MKRSTWMLMIFFLAIGLSLFCSCSVSFNVLGDWAITITYPGGGVATLNVTFTGQETEGSLTLYGSGWNATGTYEVDHKEIDFEASSTEFVIIFTGTMDSDSEMRGTANEHTFGYDPIDVTWVGIRK